MDITLKQLRFWREKTVVDISGMTDFRDKKRKIFFLCKSTKLRFVFEPYIQYKIRVILQDFIKKFGCRYLISTYFKYAAYLSHLRFCSLLYRTFESGDVAPATSL